MKRTVILTAIAALAFSMALANGPRFQSSTRTTYGAAFGATPVRAGTILATSLHDDAAALLGLTPAELTALRLEGKTLAEIATDLGQDPATLQASLVEARNLAIDQAVQNGELTDAQAVYLKSRSEAVVEAQVQREIGPNATFANGYGPARGTQAFGPQANRTGSAAAAQRGYAMGARFGSNVTARNGAGPVRPNGATNRPMGRMGPR